MPHLSLCFALFLSLLSLVAGLATSTESDAAIGTFPASQIAGSTSTDVSALATQTPSIVTAPASQNVPSSVLAMESSIFTSPSTTPRPLPATASAQASSSVSSIASSTLGLAVQTPSASVHPTSAPTGGPTLNTTIIVIIAVAGGAVLLIAIGVTIFCCIRRRNHKRQLEQRSGSASPGSRAGNYVDLEKIAHTRAARGAPTYRGAPKLEPLKTDFGALSSDDAFSSPVKPVASVRQTEKKHRKKRTADTNKDLPAGPAAADPFGLGQSPDNDTEAVLGFSPESPLSLLANGRFSNQLRSGVNRPPMPTIPSGQQPSQASGLNVPSAPTRAYSPSLYSNRDSATPAGRAPSTQLVVSEQEASRFSFGFGAGAPSSGPVVPTAGNLAAAARGPNLNLPPNQRPGSRRSMNSGGSGSVFESAPWPPTKWGGQGPRYVNGRWA